MWHDTSKHIYPYLISVLLSLALFLWRNQREARERAELIKMSHRHVINRLLSGYLFQLSRTYFEITGRLARCDSNDIVTTTSHYVIRDGETILMEWKIDWLDTYEVGILSRRIPCIDEKFFYPISLGLPDHIANFFNDTKMELKNVAEGVYTELARTT